MKRPNHKTQQFITLVFLVAISLASSRLASAANLQPPSAILNQYRDQRVTWFTAVWPYANNLFGMLAVIEFAWSAAVMLLEKTDLQSWVAALVRKVMWLGAFYALLLYGRFWIPAITDSFELIGQNAAGTGPMSPSDVFTRGIDLAGALMATSSSAAFFTNLGASLTMVVTGIVTALAFIAITVQFVVAMVESYVIVAAAFIFVGFGGSRWTAPYVERYIGLGVSNGVKIMLLYLLIGTGMQLSAGWMTQAENIASNSSPAMSALEIMGASIIFMMLCWQIPKLLAAVLGGSPALSGGDLVSTSTFLAGSAAAVGSLAATGIGSAVAGVRTSTAAAGTAGGGTANGTTSAATASTKPPSPPPPSANSSSNSVPPPSPSSPAPPAPATRSGSIMPDVRRRLTARPPSDSAPHAGPPRMNLDHQE
ncbi:MAG TPA: P-type conjugative transfer protein TrbL [Bryobacteraceae bacterium]|nr:P-type conjugative transfer protein TrbL [Bryobacteraceae bacterium]